MIFLKELQRGDYMDLKFSLMLRMPPFEYFKKKVMTLPSKTIDIQGFYTKYQTKSN